MHFDVIFKLSATLSVTVSIVVSGAKEMLYLDANLYKRWRPSVDPSLRSFVCAAFSKVKVTKLSKKEKEKENKYRGGTSDATTSSSLIVSFICHLMTFYPQKRPYSSFEDNTGHTDGRTDRRTDGHDLL